MNPASRSLNLPGQHEYHGAPFPLALEVTADSLEDACTWITENATDLDAQAAAHGEEISLHRHVVGRQEYWMQLKDQRLPRRAVPLFNCLGARVIA